MRTNRASEEKEIQEVSCGRFIDVHGSKMHYRELGEGRPIVFLHGMPVSSYVWRNVLRACSHLGRCIAPDLIGMGQSDQPEIDYTIDDHASYIEGFIENLELKDVVLVMHGWGSLFGFEYARTHSDVISGLAFFESHIRPISDSSMLSLPVQQLSSMLSNRDVSYRAVIEQNYMIRKVLPSCAVGEMSEVVLQEYQKPFMTEKSRQVLWQYLQDLPLGRGPENVIQFIDRYSNWLQSSEVPKLMLYAMPGFITTIDTVSWARDHLPNLTQYCLEDVMHLPQESVPGLFSQALIDWYDSNWNMQR
ncbi:MAG: haloalkane dehalogenase [Coxiellaceae bacterium]|nr:haloalkane dehalogenase [Coxiellaceae bacterium]|tara:strand:- start:344 stop:1255 length:912 start_codon:yes stop_codon:yes gene_type:complete